jgi:hypothetical protein
MEGHKEKSQTKFAVMTKMSDQILIIRNTMLKAINESVMELRKEGIINGFPAADLFILTAMSRVVCDCFLSVAKGDTSVIDKFIDDMSDSLRQMLLIGKWEKDMLQ